MCTRAKQAMFVRKANARKTAMIDKIDIYGVQNLRRTPFCLCVAIFRTSSPRNKSTMSTCRSRPFTNSSTTWPEVIIETDLDGILVKFCL
jgi:hypothetical protein